MSIAEYANIIIFYVYLLKAIIITRASTVIPVQPVVIPEIYCLAKVTDNSNFWRFKFIKYNFYLNELSRMNFLSLVQDNIMGT